MVGTLRMEDSGSSRKPRVLIVTEMYPYRGSDDAFLPAEVEVLASSFEITVCPVATSPHEIVRLPPGVILERGLAIAHKDRLILLKGLFRALFSVDTHREIFRQTPKSLSPRAFATVFTRMARALLVERWVTDNVFANDRLAPEIIYSWWSASAAYGLTRALASSEIPFVTRAHGYDLFAQQERVGFVPFQRQIIERADVVYSVSHAGAAYLRSAYPDLAEKISTAYLGIDEPNHLGRSSTDGMIRIVSCSSLVSVKRVDLLAEALGVLATSTPFVEFHWTHIGAGPLAAELAARVASLRNLRGRVTFLGYLQPEDVRRWYSEHPIDLVVNVSESEGLPVSLMEAASFGIPMLATAVGGTPEIVRNGAGILIPVDSTPQQVAEAIAGYIMLDPADKDTMRAASRARFESDFRADTNYGAFAGLLSEMAHAS